MAYRPQYDQSPYPPSSPARQNGHQPYPPTPRRHPDARYYSEYDPYNEPSQLPYGQPAHPMPYGPPDHQAPYSPSYASHQPHDFPTSQQPYLVDQDPRYPPDADPYYSHPQAHQPAYFPEYESGSGSGQHYGMDEKHGIEHYPPPSLSGEGTRTGSAYANPTRGSVAAQMAAEGAIPEKAGLRMWRSDEHSGAFMRGGKGKCCGRCCCCSLIVVVLLLIGIVAGFLLWVRPPNATFNGIEAPTAGNQVDLQTGGFLLNFDLNPIKISFDITLKLKVLAIAIAPTFSSSNTFTCPLKQSDFNAVLGGQQSMAALQQMLTGTTTDANSKLRRRDFYDWIGSLDKDALEVELNQNMRLRSIGLPFGWLDWLILPRRTYAPAPAAGQDGSGWTGLRDKLVLMLRR